MLGNSKDVTGPQAVQVGVTFRQKRYDYVHHHPRSRELNCQEEGSDLPRYHDMDKLTDKRERLALACQYKIYISNRVVDCLHRSNGSLSF